MRGFAGESGKARGDSRKAPAYHGIATRGKWGGQPPYKHGKAEGLFMARVWRTGSITGYLS
jgi:hypothetical protein